ncbi:MAG: 50S ribosomal protein L5 [Phycisphaerae bacterium]|nr:50S ribosomal protein L5 [Phycisphaerae bacterium]
MVARLHEKYRQEVLPVLAERYGRGNLHAAARLQKVVISMGLGAAQQDQARLEAAEKELALIAGQKPVVTLARKAISNFKLREGMKIGLKVTLRGERMYEFLDRLITLAIPRVKDFRGLNPSGFDGRGGYNMGLIEQTVFPEIDPASVTFTQGMNIAFDTSAKTDEEARDLLSMMGMPFRRED